MMITEDEQYSLDIDWFFTNGEEIGFVASAGGKLPDSIAKSIEKIKTLALYFGSLPQICDVIINPDLGKVIPNRTINERYLLDFVSMSKKGLYSFDKTVLNNFSDLDYHLVSSPTKPLKFNELSIEIAEVLIETRIGGHIGINLNMDSCKIDSGSK